ncbi:MAG: alpha/beta fold hydrolase [Gammaproteobacteria bacterium]|nr:alpha/beta fold hydrolase [Gammaproteobacteria bacterium]
MMRRIYSTRYGQLHVRSRDGAGRPLVLLHQSPRAGDMWEPLQAILGRPTFAPDRLGYGYSDAPPWALSLEQYAESTIDALDAAGIAGPIDVLGVNVGSLEAIEIAHQLADRVRKVAIVGVPLFTVEEQQRQLEKYSEQPLRPAVEGGHLLGAWRGCFAFRAPPYDLTLMHRRFAGLVLAANPGAALRAAAGYPLERKLKGLKQPLTVFAPRDEIIEQTMRVKPLMKPEGQYVDLPDLSFDIFDVATERMAALIEQHLADARGR